MADFVETQHGKNHRVGGSDPIPGFGDMTLLAVIDGGGEPISTGIAGDVTLDRRCAVVAWTLLADTAGDLIVDVWRDDLAAYPPSVGDSITGGSPPELAGQDHARDEALDGWDIEIAAGDTLRFNVDSASAVSRATLALTLRPR